jgi:hypothetical protein
MHMQTIEKYLPYILFVAFVMAVMVPLFAPGYIFLLDMGFPPDMHVQPITGNIIPSNYPLRYILYVVAQSIGTPLTTKLLLAGVLLLPGIAMYRLSKKYFSRSLATLSGIIYMANPWVYERFFSGQWLVMAGYGMLPIFISYLVTLVNAPTKKHIIKFAIVASLYPIFSLHFAYIAYAFGFVYMLGWVVINRNLFSRAQVLRACKVVLAVIVCVGVVNSFWLYGALHKKDSSYQEIVTTDFRAFATTADQKLGVYPNVLGLYGFWSSDELLPKDTNPYWFVVPGLYILIASFGIRRAWQEKNRNLLPFILFVTFIPVVIVSVGYGSAFSKAIVDWLLGVVPGFKGLRETEKLSGLIALSYAFLVSYGVLVMTELYFKNKIVARRTLVAGLVAVTLVAIYPMAWGYQGQLTPSEYPKDWYSARTYIDSKYVVGEDTKAVLLLPWHQYMDISFANYRRIVNPAIMFFNNSVVASKNVDNAYLDSARTDPWEVFITLWVQGVTPTPEAVATLKANNVGYIVLLKESDWQKYWRITESSELKVVLDTPTIIVYEFE